MLFKISSRIALSVLCGLLIIIFLHQYALYKLGVPNGFNRIINNKILRTTANIDLESSSFYISGLNSKEIILGNNSKSGELRIINYDLTKSFVRQLSLPDSIKFGWGAAKIYSSNRDYYLAEGVTPKIFKFDSEGEARPVLTAKMPPFDLFVPMDSLFVFRTYEKTSHRNVLAVARPGLSVQMSSTLLVSQQEGVFSTDGILLRDDSLDRFYYIYGYRNGIVSFDKELRLIKFQNTIDTNSIAKIRISKIKSSHEFTLSSPPLKVNKHACIGNGRLFIYSGLRADNEHGKLSYLSCPIDVYCTDNLKYLYSFYVPDYDQSGIHDFAVYGKYLVLLKGSHIMVCQMDQAIFDLKRTDSIQNIANNSQLLTNPSI